MANSKFDAKSFNPEAFKYMVGRVPNLTLNALKKSRALAGNPDIRAVFTSQNGTGYARLAMRGLLDGDAVNYDGETDITATSTKTFEQGMVVVGRAKAWTEKDFSYDITLPQLRVILESLCGAGNYSADVADYTLLVKVGVAAKKNFQDVQTLLKRVAPVNLVLVVQQLFNIHQVLGGFTHAQLAWYTHSEVRTEELQTHECTPHKTLRPFTHAQLGGLENKSIRKEMTDGTVHT